MLYIKLMVPDEDVEKKKKHKHGWFSGIIAACHAADPGSIPGSGTPFYFCVFWPSEGFVL